jgi:hypothetical protein
MFSLNFELIINEVLPPAADIHCAYKNIYSETQLMVKSMIDLLLVIRHHLHITVENKQRSDNESCISGLFHLAGH